MDQRGEVAGVFPLPFGTLFPTGRIGIGGEIWTLFFWKLFFANNNRVNTDQAICQS
jgi:hypothetical protein